MNSHPANISIVQQDIVEMNVDAIVNAANEGLRAGSGVCGAIFAAAGRSQLQAACDQIGHCPTGSAVITPGFDLPAAHVIHAVGPIWRGGGNNEETLLASCYTTALDLAMEHRLRSIAFPLISSGIFGYPKQEAWRVALGACRAKLAAHPDYVLEVRFCVLNEDALEMGQRIMEETATQAADGRAGSSPAC